jgi:hypothetical protein
VYGVAGSVSRLDVSVILKSSDSNTTTRIYLYDFTTRAWTQLQTSTIGPAEATRTSAVSTNAGRYVGAGTVRLRILSSKLLSTHSLSVELARLAVTP